MFSFPFQMSAQGQSWQKDAADQNFDYMFKLLIIGNSSVGKTRYGIYILSISYLILEGYLSMKTN